MERLGRSGWTLAPSASETCPFITLTGHTWESYLAILGSKTRCNVRRRLRYLDQEGARFEQVVSPEQLREVLPALFRLHDLRWRERGGSQAFHRAGLVSFQEEWTRRALARTLVDHQSLAAAQREKHPIRVRRLQAAGLLEFALANIQRRRAHPAFAGRDDELQRRDRGELGFRERGRRTATGHALGVARAAPGRNPAGEHSHFPPASPLLTSLAEGLR